MTSCRRCGYVRFLMVFTTAAVMSCIRIYVVLCFNWFSQPNQLLQEDKKTNAPIVDHRSLDDLLTFINGENGEEEKLGTKSKSQKKARQKQKKVSQSH